MNKRTIDPMADHRNSRGSRSGNQSDSSKVSPDLLTISVFQSMLDSALERQKGELVSMITADLRAEFDALREEFSAVKAENSVLKDIVCSQQKSIMRLEQRDRDNNVVIIGLPDSSNSEADSAKVNSLIKAVCPKDPKSVVKNFYRLGKFRSNKSRAVKVELTCPVTRKAMLQKAKQLGTHDAYKDVRIKPDLCELDRIENKRIYSVFVQQKTANPGKNVELSQGVVTVDKRVVDRRDPIKSLFRA